jgi:predicted secreted protein
MKIYSSVSAFLILLLMSVSLLAGDYADLNFVGFSRDGNFLAFEEYGVQDGSGFPYSNFYFVNIEKNSFAAPPVSARIDKEMATEIMARNKAQLIAANKLRELKIIKGNTGKHVVSHLMNDLTFDEDSGAGASGVVRFAAEIGSMYRKGFYELSLKPLLTKTKDCEAFEQKTFRFELSLKDKENNTTKFLQKDAELPKSRGCALGYRIQDIYLYENNIAVFLNVFKLGFEGPDMRFIVVSGKLK